MGYASNTAMWRRQSGFYKEVRRRKKAKRYFKGPEKKSHKSFQAWRKYTRKKLLESRPKEEIRFEKRLLRLGLRFKAQAPIGKYFADFLLRDHNIVVEIDGNYHNDPDQKIKDDVRTIALKSYGCRVLRLPNKRAMKMKDEELLKLVESFQCVSGYTNQPHIIPTESTS